MRFLNEALHLLRTSRVLPGTNYLRNRMTLVDQTDLQFMEFQNQTFFDWVLNPEIG